MFSVVGKVALITGGASGNGFRYATELLRNGLRAVTLADINENYGRNALNEIREKFGDNKATFCKVDVTDINQLEDGFKKTVHCFKNVDILINNAGIMDDRVWEKQIGVNFNGTVHGTLLGIQNYIQKYKSSSEGVIVNISSIAGLDPSPIVPIYSATKNAVIGLTRSFGTKMHYKLSNVRIFAVCPGLTNTSFIHKIEEKGMKPEYASSFKKIQHLIVVQEPEELAKHVVGLIETAANGSVWVIENKEPPYELQCSPRQELRKVNA